MVNLKNLSSQYGLTFDKKRQLAYGSYHGYLVILQLQTREAQCLITVNVKADETHAAALTDHLSQLAANSKNVKFATYKSPVISAAATSRGAIYKNETDEAIRLLDDIVNYSSMNQLPPCCATCGSEGSLAVYSVMGGYGILCPTCFEKSKSDLSNAQQELHEKPTNYAAGIVGALLGTLPGVALWLLIAQMGRIAAVSALVMMLGSIWGFKKLGGGKLNIGGVIITVVITAAMLYGAEYASTAIEIYKALQGKYDVTFFEAFKAVPKILKDEDVFGGFLHDLLIGYVFLIAAAASSVYHAFKQSNLKFEMKRMD